MRRIAPFAVVVAVAVLAAACTGPGSASSPSLSPSGPVVTIEAGLTPRMTAEQVEAVALQQILRMESLVGAVVRPPGILAVTATTVAGVASLEPRSGHQEPPAPGIQWLVRAEGTFTNNRTPPGASPMVAATGFFVIGDADGGVIGFGFP